MDDGQSPTRRAHTASGLPTRSTLREREAALTQRLKDAVSREGELQGRIADAAEREQVSQHNEHHTMFCDS